MVYSDPQFAIAWVDHDREPKNPPNPAFPHGQDLDVTGGKPFCAIVQLPYPAARCGIYVIKCRKCGVRVGVTTAGRPDDPRTVKFACRLKEN